MTLTLDAAHMALLAARGRRAARSSLRSRLSLRLRRDGLAIRFLRWRMPRRRGGASSSELSVWSFQALAKQKLINESFLVIIIITIWGVLLLFLTIFLLYASAFHPKLRIKDFLHFTTLLRLYGRRLSIDWRWALPCGRGLVHAELQGLLLYAKKDYGCHPRVCTSEMRLLLIDLT